MKKLLATFLVLMMPALASAESISSSTGSIREEIEANFSASSTLKGYYDESVAYIKENAPGLLVLTTSTYARVEAWRTEGAISLSTKALEVYAAAEAEGRGAHTGPTASTTKTTSYKTVGKQFEYLALSALAYLFDHRFLFYAVALVLLWFVLRKIIQLIRRLFNGRSDY